MLGERFGAAMAMFGARLAIGARLGGPGVSVYLYQRDNDEWVYETELPSVPFMYPQPKLDVALTADRIAFGGTTGIPGTDGVVIFRLNEIGWEWEQTITEFPNGPTGTFFGYAVAMHGDRLVIGDPNFVNGRAYVFQYRQGIWAYEALLTASDGASNDFFGQSVAISGNIIVVSAPSKFHFGNPVYGSVYVFELISGRWVETQIITQSGLPGSIHAIGDSLAMGHGWLVIGDSGQWVIPSFIPGNAFVYRRQEGSWVFDAILSGSQATSQDRFG